MNVHCVETPQHQASKLRTMGHLPPESEGDDWRKPIIQHLKNPMELSDFAFHEELGILQAKLPHYFLKKGKLKRSFANG
jgi:hypothetical protein